MNQEMNRILANLSEEVQAERKKEAKLTQSVAVPDLDPLFVQEVSERPFSTSCAAESARLSSATRADRAVLSEAGQWPAQRSGWSGCCASISCRSASIVQSVNLSDPAVEEALYGLLAMMCPESTDGGGAMLCRRGGKVPRTRLSGAGSKPLCNGAGPKGLHCSALARGQPATGGAP